MRIFLIAAAATAVAAFVVATRRAAVARSAAATSLPSAIAQSVPLSMLVPPDEPIAAEAGVFRTGSGVLAIEPARDYRRAAHPRTLATFRALRVYPGAPPRIPHGLTPVEFRTGACKTCHERGGFSPRFGAYVPVTPHPEMGACLQCHVGDAKLVAVALPSTNPNDRCRQCHAPGAGRWRDSTLNWTPLSWPQLAVTLIGRNPPPIPHDLELRGNCLTCHSGPSGVAEIQTPHPERINCRQCHLLAAEPDVYVRPPPLAAGGSEGPR